MELNRRIREAMLAAGLKKLQFANAVGVSSGAVTQWLDGTTKSLKASTAVRMQEVTGYSSAWLVTGIGEKLARKITENLKLARGSMDEREAAIPVTAPTDDVSNLKLQTVAQRLKWAREFKGWTQAHLAGLAGCTTGTIGNIESGIRLSKGSQPKIAEALGVSLKWLSDGIGERLIAPEPRRLSREAMQLANLLMCLPEEKQADAARAAIDIFISYLSPVTGESQPFAVVDNESRKS